jgi:hypothetical protein
MTLFALALFALVVPTIVSAAMIERHRAAWAPRYKREERVETAGEGAFRSAEVRESRWSIVGDGLPTPVFIAAFVAFTLGQLWFPTVISAAVGVLFVLSRQFTSNSWFLPALVLASVPGTLVAIEHFRAGLALLRGALADAESLTRSSLRHTLSHNVVLLAMAFVAWLTGDHEADSAWLLGVAAAPFVLSALLSRWVAVRYRAKFVADDPDALFALPEPGETVSFVSANASKVAARS